jgi:bifunctional non-homologous end joining protein LigD
MASPSGADQVARVLEQLDDAGTTATLTVGRHRVDVTSLDKPLWPAARPAATKRDLLRYLAAASPWLLPHLKDRPVFVTRAPDGVGGKKFFQKKFPDAPAFVRSLAVFSPENKGAIDLLLVSNLATLLWLGQFAALEYHVWFSRIGRGADGRGLGTDYALSEAAVEESRLNYPDFLVADLDAYLYSGKEGKGEEPRLHRKGFAMVRDVALEVREIALSLGLSPHVKTSGKTGLHLYLPILRDFTFDEVREMARTLGEFAAQRAPKQVTLEWSVDNRSGKVFFDFNQNVRGKSLAAALSPRMHPKATVSMPLRWDELASVYPTDFTLRTAAEHVARHGDPWADILEHKADLGAALGMAGSEPGG